MTDAQGNGVKRWRCNCIPVPRQVLAESDHERVVADLEAQVFNEGIRHRHEANELDKTIATQAKEIEKLKFIQGPTDKTLANVLGELETANKKIEKYKVFINAIESQALAWIIEPMDGHGTMLRNIGDMTERCAKEVAALSDEVQA